MSLTVGDTVTGASRTITDAEVALLPTIMGAISPLFHDEESAKASPLGRRVLYGPALMGIAIAGTEPALKGQVVALLQIDEVRFRQAVGVGDTVTPTLTVTERRERAGKPTDVICVEDSVCNQHGDVVLEFRRTILVRGSTT